MNYGYTYIITFLDTGHYYIGKRLCPKGKTPWTDDYWGSAVTYKKEFESDRPKHKLIRDVISETDRRIVNKKISDLENEWQRETNSLYDPLSYNENVGNAFSVESCKKAGGITGKITLEQETGIHNPKYRKSKKFKENCKKGGKIGGRISGKKIFQEKKGIFKYSEEKRKEFMEKARKKSLKNKADKRKAIWNKKDYENLFNLYHSRKSRCWGKNKYCRENNLDKNIAGNMAKCLKKGLTYNEAISPLE